ncbi:MAG: hypothetical protein WCO81_08195 [Cyanobacteriota bacterium ELA615]
MNRKPRIGYLFFIGLLATFIFYLLRGLQIVTFLPGSILIWLAILTVILGFVYLVESARKF